MMEYEEDQAIVTDELAGQRIDIVVAAVLPDISRSLAQKMIRDGAVLRNGCSVKPKEIAQEGDILDFFPYRTPQISAAPEDLPLEIVFEDDAMLVVNKPQGMATHPAPGTPGGTLVNALMGRGVALSDEGGELRPGIVHRLDKDTSGLLVVAKTATAHRFLSTQLADRSLSRRYLALVWGVPRWRHAHVDAPIGRHPSNRQKMAVVPREGPGRSAITDLDLLEPLGPVSLLRARLQSGRTHQIRVHTSYAGHPVLGDPIYGGERPRETRTLSSSVQDAIFALPGQALHAAYIRFIHPVTHENLDFSVSPPDPFWHIMNTCGSGFSPDSLLDAVRAEPPASGESAGA